MKKKSHGMRPWDMEEILLRSSHVRFDYCSTASMETMSFTSSLSAFCSMP